MIGPSEIFRPHECVDQIGGDDQCDRTAESKVEHVDLRLDSSAEGDIRRQTREERDGER
jgi:hypothetical protein